MQVAIYIKKFVPKILYIYYVILCQVSKIVK